MNTWFFILTVIFIVAAVAMILIILVQRPQGGGLAGAFGGAGGSSTDTVFGGRVGDALTTMTVVAFVVYLLLAIGLNRVDSRPGAVAEPAATDAVEVTSDGTTPPTTGAPDIGIPGAEPVDQSEVPPEIIEQILKDRDQKLREGGGGPE